MSVLEKQIRGAGLLHEQWETLSEATDLCQHPQKRWQHNDWCEPENLALETWKTETHVLPQTRIPEAYWKISSHHFPFQRITATKPKVELVESSNASKFHRLAGQWYNETGMLSMIHKKSMHPAYQKIIGMGKDALPFIFQEMKKNQVHWLWALVAIHGDDIAKPGCSLKEAVAAWVEWGTENGYA